MGAWAPVSLGLYFFPPAPLMHWPVGKSRTAELTGGSQIICKDMGECSVVCSFLLMGVGLVLIFSLLQPSAITRQNSDNHYSNDYYPVKFPFVLEEQLIFNGKQMPSSGVYGWKNPLRKGMIILKCCGSITLAVGFFSKPGYNSYDRLIASFSVPSGMCHQTNSAL